LKGTEHFDFFEELNLRGFRLPFGQDAGCANLVMIDEQPNSLDLTFRTAHDARVGGEVWCIGGAIGFQRSVSRRSLSLKIHKLWMPVGVPDSLILAAG
jgi:hypothetical protein